MLLRAFLIACLIELPLAIWSSWYVNRGGEVEAPSNLSYYHALPLIFFYLMNMILHGLALRFLAGHWTMAYFLTVFFVQSVVTTPVVFLVLRMLARRPP